MNQKPIPTTEISSEGGTETQRPYETHRLEPKELETFHQAIRATVPDMDPRMLPRTTEKSQSVASYGVFTENGDVVGSMDIYDPRLLAGFHTSEILVWKADAKSYTWTGEGFKQAYERTWNEAMSVQNYLELLSNNPWACCPYIANVFVLPTHRPPLANSYGTKLVEGVLSQHYEAYGLPQDSFYWGITDNPSMLKVARRFGGQVIAESRPTRKGGQNIQPAFRRIHFTSQKIYGGDRIFGQDRIEIAFCGDQGTQLVLMNDELVAIRILETMDASPPIWSMSPAQSILVIKPGLTRPSFETFARFLYDQQELQEVGLWENAFQLPDDVSSHSLPIEKINLDEITKHRKGEPTQELKQDMLFIITP